MSDRVTSERQCRRFARTAKPLETRRKRSTAQSHEKPDIPLPLDDGVGKAILVIVKLPDTLAGQMEIFPNTCQRFSSFPSLGNDGQQALRLGDSRLAEGILHASNRH